MMGGTAGLVCQGRRLCYTSSHPRGCELNAHCCENIKSYTIINTLQASCSFIVFISSEAVTRLHGEFCENLVTWTTWRCQKISYGLRKCTLTSHSLTLSWWINIFILCMVLFHGSSENYCYRFYHVKHDPNNEPCSRFLERRSCYSK
jgi:hypothetical protein